MGFPSDIAVKNSPANAGDADWALGLRRSPGGGNVNPFQYSCLENSMDRGAWWATVHRVTHTHKINQFTQQGFGDLCLSPAATLTPGQPLSQVDKVLLLY